MQEWVGAHVVSMAKRQTSFSEYGWIKDKTARVSDRENEIDIHKYCLIYDWKSLQTLSRSIQISKISLGGGMPSTPLDFSCSAAADHEWFCAVDLFSPVKKLYQLAK